MATLSSVMLRTQDIVKIDIFKFEDSVAGIFQLHFNFRSNLNLYDLQRQGNILINTNKNLCNGTVHVDCGGKSLNNVIKCVTTCSDNSLTETHI